MLACARGGSWMDGMEMPLVWFGWGFLFDVMWCGHWCYREGRKEGFKDCRLP